MKDKTQTQHPKPLSEIAVHLHPLDQVAIARSDISAGSAISFGENRILITAAVPGGHKFAMVDVPAGGEVRRYGQVIGFASQEIRAGDHVHTHNLGVGEFKRNPENPFTESSQSLISESQRRTFMGYRRKSRRPGTRNYIAIVSTVNCSAHAVKAIAAHFTPERLAPYPNVDGVIAFTHPHGCGVAIGGLNYTLLQRTLAGMARHPNVAASLVVGLGCETNQVGDLVRNYALDDEDGSTQPLVIQELGGTASTIKAGIDAVSRILPEVNAYERQQIPISELTLALQCGGSDGWSGVSANPLVGLVSDKLVRQGGAVLLAETPEIFGAEHLLTARTPDPANVQKLLAQVGWWQEHTRQSGMAMDSNRSPGNAAGGLTTIYEKALGAVAKGGNTPLMGVYEYAEQIASRGLSFMNSPGNDSISVTGQVAGGCNLVLFTTGRGSVFGFKPAPSIKISTNSTLYERMSDDIDFNSGIVLEGIPMEMAAADLFELVIATASGQPSKSEAMGIGEMEFNPWFLGGVM